MAGPGWPGAGGKHGKADRCRLGNDLKFGVLTTTCGYKSMAVGGKGWVMMGRESQIPPTCKIQSYPLRLPCDGWMDGWISSDIFQKEEDYTDMT